MQVHIYELGLALRSEQFHLRFSKLPFGDMAHIKLSYDFDLEISPGPVLGF